LALLGRLSWERVDGFVMQASEKPAHCTFPDVHGFFAPSQPPESRGYGQGNPPLVLAILNSQEKLTFDLDLMGGALYVIKVEFRPNAFCTCASRGVPANDFLSRTSIDAAPHDAGARLLVL
jgi:hypothetical protein